MINFIVCEDNNIILNKNIDIINKTMFNNNTSYKIYKFLSYNNELRDIIKSDMENKIYILDIELDNKSGIDISREIRNEDINSFIILSTAHTEYLPYTIKSKLLIFDFVSKFDDYEINLSRVIKNILTIYYESRTIDITTKDSIKRIYLNDILELKYNKTLGKTEIITKKNVYYVKKSLNAVFKSLDERFVKSGNGTIVNSDYALEESN